jgi:Ca-activated chloride channel family protein
MLVTVKNSAGELIGSLEKKDFAVADCGVKQEIQVFERQTAQPLYVALMIDISGSTAKDLRYETTSISKFLRALFGEGNLEDAVSLFSFNYDVAQLTGFTRNRQLVEDRLRTVHPEGGTSLYDAIYLAARELRQREGRRVMVIVTDGGNTTSNRNYRDALEAAQRADAILFPILVVPITNDAGRNLGGERALTTLAQDTGGRVFEPDVAHLDTAFADILRALRTQYLIGYYPRNLPRDAPRFHPVSVTVKPESPAGGKAQDLRVSARSGYYESSH